jgi:uroporphyrinogen decarboxylase
MPTPDFQRFKDVLLLKRTVNRPPQFDFHIDRIHKQALLGRLCVSPQDEIDFFAAAGYDYVQVSAYVPYDEIIAATHAQRREQNTASHSANYKIIRSLEHFKSKAWSWSPLEQNDFSPRAEQLDFLKQTADLLPHVAGGNMKILLHCADIFTFAWEMIGFDELCLASLEEPEFVDAVMGSLARANQNLLERALAIAGDKIGAVLYSDDIAYTEGLMLSPDFFRKALFPRIKKIADAAKTVDAPLIYHSDGRLFQVFDDLHAIGVRGIQPLEPKSMDPLDIKKRWPGKFCLLGNIDLDLMSRGTPEQVEKTVREKIRTLNVGGGYMPGVSNTVPHYVKTENYLRMLKTIQSLPD